MSFIRWLLLLALCIPAPALAQEILPASISNWSSPGAADVDAVHLAQIAGPAAAALNEYGAQRGESRTFYQGHPGKQDSHSFVANVYAFSDASGAYGAYSFFRTPDMPAAKFTKHSSMSREHALVLTGNLVLDIRGKNLTAARGEIEMLTAIAGGHAKWGVYPNLPQRLPLENLVPRSDHFLLGPIALEQFLSLGTGDWLGFSKGAEAELARYDFRGHPTTLVLADYPTPQIAAAQFVKFEKQYGTTPQGEGTANGSPVFMHRDGTLVALLTGGSSASEAQDFLSGIHSGMISTWNVPVPDAHQPSMAMIVVGTIIGAGQICGITILGGLLFAGIRLGMKKRWPGKFFDRPQQTQVIQLGLTTKPIDTNELY